MEFELEYYKIIQEEKWGQMLLSREQINNNINKNQQYQSTKKENEKKLEKPQQFVPRWSLSKKSTQTTNKIFKRTKPPRDTCAFISVFDLISGSDYCKEFPITKHLYPGLIEALQGKLTSYQSAIKQIKTAYSFIFTQKNSLEDPGIVLACVQEMLDHMSPTNQKPTLPIMECSYQGQTVEVKTNIQLQRVSADRYEILNIGDADGQTKYKYLPNQFFARVEQKYESNQFIITKDKIYGLKQYCQASIIQYNPTKKHFRCVRILAGGKTVVLDEDTVTESNNNKQQVLKQRDWINYIYRMRRLKQFWNNQFPQQHERIHKIDPVAYRRIYEGASSNKKTISSYRILEWNICAYTNKKKSTVDALIKQHKPTIAFIVEPRRHISLSNYTTFSSLPAPGVNQKVNCNLLIGKNIFVQKRIQEVDYVSVVVTGQPFLRPTLLVCTYFNCNQVAYENKINAQRLLLEDIVSFTENNESANIIIAGDFNKTIKQIEKLAQQEQLYSILTSLNKSIKTDGTSRRTDREIDHVWTNGLLNNMDIQIQHLEGQFDHFPILAQIETDYTKEPQKVPDRRTARLILSELLSDENPTIQTYQQLRQKYQNNLLREQTIEEVWEKKVKQDQIKAIATKQYKQNNIKKMNDVLQQISEDRFTTKSKLAFQKMRRITKYNQFEKRDGGFMVRAMHNGRVINGKELDQQLINHYHQIHNSLENTQKVEFPELNIDTQKIVRLSQRINQNKGLAFDGVDQKLFKIGRCSQRQNINNCPTCQSKLKIIQGFLKAQYWQNQASKIHFVGRLCALNKVYPMIGQLKQYRPIVILSGVVKFLESYLVESLQQYSKKKNVINQFGFVKGVSIEECKLSMIKQISARKQNDLETVLLFIDLKSAYNRVNRIKLIQMVQKKGILNQTQIQLLKFIFHNTRTRKGEYETQLSNGLNQGSVIAPLLFNIYIQSLHDRLKPLQIDERYYADDVLTLSQMGKVKETITTIRNWCQEFNMEINQEKSGILIVDSKTKLSPRIKNIQGIPLVNQYKYLGLQLDKKLSFKPHIKYISKKISYITYKLYGLRQLDNLKLNVNLFKVFILPLYKLAMSVYGEANNQMRKSLITHMKVKLKIFCRIPINTANKALYQIAGDLKYNYEMQMYKTANKTCDHYDVVHLGTSYPSEKGAKHIPMNYSKLLRGFYHSKCKHHDSALLNTTHVNKFHLPEFKSHLESKNVKLKANQPNGKWQLSITDLIAGYQIKQARSTISSQIKIIIQYLEQQRVTPGRPRGRPKGKLNKNKRAGKKASKQ